MPLGPSARDRAQRIAIGTLGVLLAGAITTNVWGYLSSRIERRHPDAVRTIAAALAEETEAATEGGESLSWPPPADPGAALPDTVGVEAIASTGYDGGLPDAGPPLPAPPPETPGFVVRQQEAHGLYFLEAVIGEASFEDELPMIVVLHGRGGRATIPGGPFLGLAHPVRVLVPQAPDPLGSGWQWLPVYVGQGLVDRLSATLFQAASRVAAFIRAMSHERGTVGEPIVTGFSQGGLLALTLAVHHDDVVGHAFPLACWLPPPLEPTYRREDLHYPTIRSMHGTADPTIPIEPTRELFARLGTLGYDVELVEFPDVEHRISEDENALFHVWLQRAVAETVGDADGAAVALETERMLRGLDPPDGGVRDPWDAGEPDAGAPDAGPPDAGRRRRGR